MNKKMRLWTLFALICLVNYLATEVSFLHPLAVRSKIQTIMLGQYLECVNYCLV